jgi:GxxExxY protein
MPMMRINKKVIYPELSYKICGLCFYVHNKLGRYRNEKQYADALEALLKENKIKYIREIPLPSSFKGERVGRNLPDFIIEDKIIVELKAKPLILKEDYFQMKRYLVSYKKKLGLMFNFRQKYLRPKRILNSKLEI